jgi:hypothetical protein
MIRIKRNKSKIPKKILKAADAASKQLEKLPKAKREKFIKKNSATWRAFSSALAGMSHKKCWYSESPENQSFCDVDHFRPKAEARRNEKETDTPGYDWLAFEWENFRYSANRSNRISRNSVTGKTDGKGSWFPLLPKSPKASWDDRCEKAEKPVLIDPVNADDVRLIAVAQDGRIVPSIFAKSTVAKYRVERSCEILGLNLPDVKSARSAVIRDMGELCTQLGELLELVSTEPDSKAANSDQLRRLCSLISSMTDDTRPYARTAQCYIANSEYGQLLTG